MSVKVNVSKALILPKNITLEAHFQHIRTNHALVNHNGIKVEIITYQVIIMRLKCRNLDIKKSKNFVNFFLKLVYHN